MNKEEMLQKFLIEHPEYIYNNGINSTKQNFVCPCGNLLEGKRKKYCSENCRLNDKNAHAWMSIRFMILEKYHFTCQYCGRKAPEVKLHIEHIKCINIYPELRNDINNLTVACFDCNIGKSDKDICLDYHFQKRSDIIN